MFNMDVWYDYAKILHKISTILCCVTQGLRIAGPYEHGNEPSGSIKGGEILN